MASRNLQMDYVDYKNEKNSSLLNTKVGPYIVESFIGSGAYGSVYRGIDDNTNKHVAIKVLDLEEIEKDPNSKVRQIRRRLSKTQSELMMKCDSDNLLKCYEVFENKSLKIMIIEYCNGGNLEDQIMAKKRIPEKQAINTLKQLIMGVSELHRHNIIHRDLKAENILVHNGIYKIADFGFSKMVIEQIDIKHTTLGTIITMAPQIMKRMPYGLKADIWSLGVIFYHMLVGRLPFEPMAANAMYEQIRNKKIFAEDRLYDNTVEISKETVNCLKRMLTLRPDDRIGWEQLISHSIFQDKPDQTLMSGFRIKQTLQKAKVNKDLEGKLRNLEEEKDLILNNLKEESEINQLNKKKEPPKIVKISAREVDDRRNGVDNSENIQFIWGKKTHWQCLKTELILKNIIIPIQQSKALSMSRKDIQCLYLFSARCFFNLSPINEEVSKNKNKVAINLKSTINDLYEKSFKNFMEYSSKLKKEEDKIGNIFTDKVSKIMKKQSYEEKEKFFVGIEAVQEFLVDRLNGEKPKAKDLDFTKEQQIRYTSKEYIPQMIKQLQIAKQPKLQEPIKLLRKYEEINLLQYSQKKEFHDLVKQMTTTK